MAKFLLLEDDRYLSKRLCEALSEHGHQVLPTFSVGDALDHLQAHPDIDLVIVDLVIDGVGFRASESGLGLLKELRAGDHSRIPTIAMSAGFASIHGAHQRELARFFGAHETLAKPFEIERLLQKISLVLPPLSPFKLQNEG